MGGEQITLWISLVKNTKLYFKSEWQYIKFNATKVA